VDPGKRYESVGSNVISCQGGVLEHRMIKRFRIAFSFAGDKRPFVGEVARILADRFGEDRILYDKYHQAEFAHSDLAFRLPALYHDEADLVVAVLCRDYENKEWPGLEWRGIFGLIKQRRVDEVMLCRFDQVEGEGLAGLAGYVDLEDKTPADLARLILERLARNDNYTKDYYTHNAPTSADWPVAAPPLEWPVADHTEAQRAFAQLITRASTFRLLLIRGASETGKSHLTKQFLRNALKLSGLTCGRFDFKGSSDMDAELRDFAELLGVEKPTPGTGVSAQLAQVFGALRRTGRPTLLIFDTFELAGEAERWVKDNLLLAMISATWLRVIIVGQRVIVPSGEAWAGESLNPIELGPPTPEDWFAYGKSHINSPDFTLEFVRAVHARVKGKSSVIAQVCRPAV
jgi:hypothetical protein